jgi:hypothetical protein
MMIVYVPVGRAPVLRTGVNVIKVMTCIFDWSNMVYVPVGREPVMRTGVNEI